MRIRCALLFCLSLTASAAGQTADQTSSSPTIHALPDVSPELVKLVVEDQWDRGIDMFTGRDRTPAGVLDWNAITKRDEQRQAAVRRLLTTGAIRTPSELRFAALVFQHSSQPDGLALAHVLASTAAMSGQRQARWLAAASFDRHQQAIGRSQVFGTQFRSDPKDAWTMEPYDRQAISDALRAEWCVVPLAEQDRMLEDVRAGKPIAPTQLRSCAEGGR